MRTSRSLQLACDECAAPITRMPSARRPRNYCSLGCRSIARARPKPPVHPPIVSPGGQIARIPVTSVDGSVVAYATVDIVDSARIGVHRWHLDKDGYAVHEPKDHNGHRTRILMHRAVLSILSDTSTDSDHINRDRLDNRRANLRPSTKAQNRQNVSKPRRPTSSRYRGVTWDERRQKWAAQVKAGGKNHYLGLFTDEEEAARAAREGRQHLLPYSVD